MPDQMAGTPDHVRTPNFSRLNDDEYVDEVHITTVPRFKTSDMSGDEWRTSARVEFLRKGVVVGYETFHNIKTALAYIAPHAVGLHPADLKMGYEEKDYNAENVTMRHTDEDFCAQPGCSEPWTIEYRLKARGCGRCGKVEKHTEHSYWEDHRRFCDRHKTRGDSDLDDMDEHYELVQMAGHPG